MLRTLISMLLVCLFVVSPVLQAADNGAADSLRLAAQSLVATSKSVVQTAPHKDIETLEDRERKYRSCLFSYLPRVGSDVAAELIRDACKAEYMR